MIWIYRNMPYGFEDLSLAEMNSAGLTQVSKRFFTTGEHFDLNSSAYAGFCVREVVRGSSAKEVIENFNEPIPSPYRIEKMDKKRRRGSLSYALLAEKKHGGCVQASNPEAIILVFSPDNTIWVAGFVEEKKDSIIHKLQSLTKRTSVSLTPHAALAMVNIAGESSIIDPCCGTGLIPLASKLKGIETYASDKNFSMLNKARLNRDSLGIDMDILHKDAFEPWIHTCCLISDFPADRSWNTMTQDLSLQLFTSWLPYITSFCVIFPDRILEKLPHNVTVIQQIKFTAGRSIVLGRVNHK